MGTVTTGVVAGIVGLLLAAATAFGVVQTQNTSNTSGSGTSQTPSQYGSN